MDRPNILIITSDRTRWNSLPAIQNALHGHYALLSEVDHHVGCMREALERLEIADDTIVVFTSDHGTFFPRPLPIRGNG